MRCCKTFVALGAFVFAVVFSSCFDDALENSFCTLDSDCSQGLVCSGGTCVMEFKGDWDRQEVDGDLDLEVEILERIDRDIESEVEISERTDGDIDFVESADKIEIEEESIEDGCFFDVRPEAIAFERVLVDSESSQEIILYNHCQDDVLIDSFEKAVLEGDSGCDEFEIVDEYGLQGEIIEGVVLSPKKLKLIYRPVDEGSDTCHLRIKSDMPDHPEFDIPMTGTGRVQQNPVALVSTRDGGQTMRGYVEVVDPIEPTAPMDPDIRLCFYGNISYDPDDGTIQEYVWTWDETPEGYTHDIISIGSYPNPDMNICIDFDVYGTYKFNLVVVDDEGLESEPFDISVNLQPYWQGLHFSVNVSGADSLLGGEFDLNMALQSQAYTGVCDKDHLDQDGNCYMLEGGECSMSPGSLGLGIISCEQLSPGPWNLTLSRDDCGASDYWDPFGGCLDCHVIIEAFVYPFGSLWYNPEPFVTMTTVFDETNNSESWDFVYGP